MSKQIRVSISDESYKELKEQSKKMNLNLYSLAGLRLNGYKITKQQEVKSEKDDISRN
jgi:hypothetical protein